MTSPINYKIIKWARQRAGFTVETLAVKMKEAPSQIELWESGSEAPSYSVLEELAYKHLKVPVAVFFFPSPPDLEDPKQNFRRLPADELIKFSPDTVSKIRLAQAYQYSLGSLISDVNVGKRIFNEISHSHLSAEEFAAQAKKYIGITLRQQVMFRSAEAAFKAWRHAIEEVGIFTFKESFEDRFLSGFSLLDKNYPVIFINNSNSFTRQLFTLTHELAHILYGVSGVTDIADAYIDEMSEKDRALEINCNKFAAHFLVPDEAFQKDIETFQKVGPDAIAEIAQRYSVSREVILRRLLEHRMVTKEFYEEMSAKWNKEYLRSEQKSSGGNYYLTRLAYLGEGFTRVAFSNYKQGRISRAELAGHLNIKSRNIGNLERYVRW